MNFDSPNKSSTQDDNSNNSTMDPIPSTDFNFKSEDEFTPAEKSTPASLNQETKSLDEIEAELEKIKINASDSELVEEPSQSQPNSDQIQMPQKNKVNFTKVLLAIGPIFLIGSLAISIFIYKNNQNQAPQQYPMAGVKVDENQKNSAKYLPTSSLFGDGSYEKPYVVMDPEDRLWQKYLPQNLNIENNQVLNNTVVTLDNPDIEDRPYSVLIGYWDQPFDANQKFQIQDLNEEEQIKWVEISQSNITYNNPQYTFYLDPTQFPDKQLYFYIYVRTVIEGNTYVDFIYQDEQKQDSYFSKLDSYEISNQ